MGSSTPAIFAKLRNTVDGPTSPAEVAGTMGRKYEQYRIKLHKMIDVWPRPGRSRSVSQAMICCPSVSWPAKEVRTTSSSDACPAHHVWLQALRFRPERRADIIEGVGEQGPQHHGVRPSILGKFGGKTRRAATNTTK